MKEKIHFLIPLSFKNVEFYIDNYYNENYYKIYVQTCVTKRYFFLSFLRKSFFFLFFFYSFIHDGTVTL